MRVMQSKFNKSNPKIRSRVGEGGDAEMGLGLGAPALDPFCLITGLRPYQAEI